MLGEHGGEPALTGDAAGDLREKVAAHVTGRSAVGGHHREKVFVDDAIRCQTHHRDAQPFGVVIIYVGGRAAWGRSAHVLMMRHGRNVADQFLAAEHRRRHRDVGQVCATLIRVVDDVEVAGFGGARWIVLREATTELGEGAEMHRDRAGLRDGAPAFVEHRGGCVQRLRHDGRVGAA